MANDTQVTIVGNLVADPELRWTQSGVAVANFTIASTPRTFDRQRNEWVDGETIFMRSTVWRDAAENLAESLAKGDRVIAQGRLQQTSFTDRDGNDRTAIELQVDEVGPSLRYATAQPRKVDRRQSSQGQPQGGYSSPQQSQGSYGAPQSSYSPQGAGNAPQGDPWAGSSGGGYDNPPPF